MLTARGEEVDRIIGLEMGADDYLPKPFNPRELAARIRAILRRISAAVATGEPEVLGAGDLAMDLGTRGVRSAGAEVELTGAEFAVLETLVRAAGTVVTRDDLSRRALGRRASAFDRSLDVHLSNLRRKLGPLPDGGERIKTVRGVGYLYVKRSTVSP
jgi:two-component system response regulator CpxR